MKVLAIVHGLYDTSPSQRYRLEQWEPLLREQGVGITYAPFEDEELHSIVYKPGRMAKKLQLVTRNLARRLSTIGKARNYDLVYILREAALLGPPVFETLIHQQRVPIVFDFDDAIFVSYRSPSNGYLSYLKFASKTKTICRLASHVMVGNPYLAEYARQVNDNVTVVVVDVVFIPIVGLIAPVVAIAFMVHLVAPLLRPGSGGIAERLSPVGRPAGNSTAERRKRLTSRHGMLIQRRILVSVSG